MEKTRGHLSNNGGLRGHSVAPPYPYMVVAKGGGRNTRWYIMRPDGSFVKWSESVSGINKGDLHYDEISFSTAKLTTKTALVLYSRLQRTGVML